MGDRSLLEQVELFADQETFEMLGKKSRIASCVYTPNRTIPELLSFRKKITFPHCVN